MARCAVYQLSDGLIVNVIVAEPDTEAPEGCGLVELGDNEPCNAGWTWNGAELIVPSGEEGFDPSDASEDDG